VKRKKKGKPGMAETPRKEEKPAAADSKPAARQRMGVRLAPVNNSDQPVLANYVTVNPAQGMVFIDFGFLEPGLLAAIPRVAKQGGKLPAAVNGKLAVRVAMGYDGLAGLHRKIAHLLSEWHKASN
jgi:hypothetical protein